MGYKEVNTWPRYTEREAPGAGLVRVVRLSAVASVEHVSVKQALIGLLVFSWALSLLLVLTHQNMLGVDGGAYIASKNFVLGLQVPDTVWPRPPLAPGWLIVPFTAVWGDDIGYKIFSAMFFVAPILPAYLVGRLFLSPWQSVLGALFVSLDLHLAEMLVTGVMPPVGFGLMMMAVWAVIKLMTTEIHQLRHFTVLVVALPLIAFTNQTTAGLTLIVLPVVIITMALLRGREVGHASLSWRGRLASFVPSKFIVLGLLLGGLLALTALPWYWDIRPGSELVKYPGSVIYFMWPDLVWPSQFILSFPVGLFVAVRGRAHSLRALGVVVMALSLLMVFASKDEAIMNIFYRSRFAIQHFWWILAVWMAYELIKPAWRQRVAWAFLPIFIPLMVWGNIWTFHNQARLSDMVTADSMVALDWLAEEHAGEGIVASTYSMAVWVEALNKVKSPPIWGQAPPAKYTEQYVGVHCLVGWSECNRAQVKDELGVEWLLVDRRYPFLRASSSPDYLSPGKTQWEVTAAAPHLTEVYRAGSTSLYHIGDS